MTQGGSPVADPISTRLALFVDDLRSELGDAASIAVEDRDGWRSVDLLPRDVHALPVSWMDFYLAGDGSCGDALQVQAGHQGGRWELGRDEDDLLFLIELVRSVVAGRVTPLTLRASNLMTVPYAPRTNPAAYPATMTWSQ